MISFDAIKQALDNNFTSEIRQRGKAYHRLGMVSSIEIDDDIVAEVRGSLAKPYSVHFSVSANSTTLTGSCTCPYDDDCKHQAAVLYAAIEKIKDSASSPSSFRRTITPAPPKPTGTSGKVVPLHSKAAVEKFSSDEYRKLSFKGNGWRNLPSLFPNYRNPALAWYESYEGHFVSPGELEIKSVARLRGYNHQPKSITLKQEDGSIFVKCNTCNKKVSLLCEHQAALLEMAFPVLFASGFLDGKLSFPSLVQQAVKETGVEPEAFNKYFVVAIDPTGFQTNPKGKNFVSQTWFDHSKKILHQVAEQRKEASIAQTKLLQEGRNRKFAFFWFNKPTHQISDLLSIHFIKGNSYKAKEGINTKDREIHEIPMGFPEPFQSIGKKLFFYLNENTDPAVKFTQVKDCIIEHLADINDIYHYVFTGTFPDEDPRPSDMQLVQFDAAELDCYFSLAREDGLIQLRRFVTLDGKPFDYSRVIHANLVFSATNTTAFLNPNNRFHDFMQLFDRHDTLILSAGQQKNLMELTSALQQYFEVDIASDLVIKQETLANPQFQILLREVGDFVLFEPQLNYGNFSFNAFDETSYKVDDKVLRPDEADRLFLVDFLKKSHPKFDTNIHMQDYVFLDFREMINNYWFIHWNEACEAAGVVVLGQKDLSKFKYSKHRAVSYSYLKSGIDWFEVDMGLSFGDEKIKTADWIKALRNKEKFVRLKDGTLGILPEEWLKQAEKVMAVAEVEKGVFKISKYRYNIIEDLFEQIDDKQIIKELREKKKRLAEINFDKKYTLPPQVKATFRDYQKHGFAWLKFLDESGFGGILADDMGLGKTLQIISLLADQQAQGTSLVIVPRSLLHNWAAELDKFCPDLTYIIHHGALRSKLIKELVAYDIIITTYGTAAMDIEFLKKHPFNYVILDESQSIKNPDSQRYKAVRLLQARNRIAMTGTPIENNTLDLFAQLSFTSPGLLGSKNSFKSNFAIPIDNQGDTEKADLLRKLIHPFLLRRTKEQVAKDLPEKTESVIYCDMGPTQRKLYDQLKQKIKEDLEAEIEEKGFAKSKFMMLDGLLRLRQMCNSPLLVNPSFKGANAQSVKIDLLMHHITEDLDNHSALIFSQFVSLLTIVRQQLDDRGIKYAYLDGATTKRQKQVDQFMNQDDIKIFLISIKAGNTGMNLTKADYVYILDPWWNPAVEAQAIDRTHRIGQDKQVFAYKLICKDSIEEKILKLQERKKNLAQDIIRTDENIMKSLKKDELLSLFD